MNPKKPIFLGLLIASIPFALVTYYRFYDEKSKGTAPLEKLPSLKHGKITNDQIKQSQRIEAFVEKQIQDEATNRFGAGLMFKIDTGIYVIHSSSLESKKKIFVTASVPLSSGSITIAKLYYPFSKVKKLIDKKIDSKTFLGEAFVNIYDPDEVRASLSQKNPIERSSKISSINTTLKNFYLWAGQQDNLYGKRAATTWRQSLKHQHTP